jgi:hypothetical protein
MLAGSWRGVNPARTTLGRDGGRNGKNTAAAQL